MRTQRNVLLLLLIVVTVLWFTGWRTGRDVKMSDPAIPASLVDKTPPAVYPDQEDAITGSRTNAITRAVEMVSPSVVGISVKSIREYNPTSLWDYFYYGGPLRQEVSGLGSGLIISSDGYIVTNDHVVGDARQITVTLTTGKSYEARLVESEFSSDIALLKIDKDNLPAAKLGNSDKILIGEWAIALGNPFGLFAFNDKPSVTVGVISAVNRDFGGETSQRRRIYQNMIQTDASINPGNSGGPLVNSNGEVIGINAFILTGGSGSTGSIGIGFAIPINKVKRVVEELKVRAETDHSYWIGLNGYSLSSREALRLGLSVSQGVIISEVKRYSPAEKANIEIGDIIVAVNGKTVTTVNDLRRYVQEANPHPGTAIRLNIVRNNKLYETTIVLEKRPRS